jgi:hypothetical protein
VGAVPTSSTIVLKSTSLRGLFYFIKGIPTIVLAGTTVRRDYQSSTRYDHYALLHTIEDGWSLPGLTSNDKQAPLMGEFFSR